MTSGGPPTNRLKSIIGGSAGNLVEWFDWYVYSAFTLYFAPAFFPSDDPTAQLLSAAAIFAVGFVMRPIGAWMMGIYADRKGRKAALQLIISLMTLSIAMIAFAPPFAAIGIAAPLLLVLARLMQGFATGGEFASATSFLIESAPANRRGLYGS